MSAPQTYFELDAQLEDLFDRIMDTEDPAAAEQLSEELARALHATEEKRDAIAFRLREYTATADRLREVSNSFRERAQVYENRVRSMRGWISAIMQAEGVKAWKGQAYKFLLVRNPDRVEVLDDAAVPDRFKTVMSPVVDKRAIKAAIESSEEVPGAELVQGDLRVDVKPL